MKWMISLILILSATLPSQSKWSSGSVKKAPADYTVGDGSGTFKVKDRVVFVSDIGDSIIFSPGNERIMEIKRYDGRSVFYVDSLQRIGYGTNTFNEPFEFHTPALSNIVAMYYSLYNRGMFRVSTITTDANFIGEDGAVSIGTAGSRGPLNFTIWNGGAIGVKTDSSSHDVFVGNAPTYSYMDAGDATFTTSSSRFLKENLQKVSSEGLLEKFSQVPVYRYNYIGENKERIGLVAEEYGQIHGRESDRKINWQEANMTLWMVCQQLSEKVKALEEVIKEQQNR